MSTKIMMRMLGYAIVGPADYTAGERRMAVAAPRATIWRTIDGASYSSDGGVRRNRIFVAPRVCRGSRR